VGTGTLVVAGDSKLPMLAATIPAANGEVSPEVRLVAVAVTTWPPEMEVTVAVKLT